MGFVCLSQVIVALKSGIRAPARWPRHAGSWAAGAAAAVVAGASLAVPAVLSSSTPASAAGVQWLHTQGNKIVDESGKTVMLRGVNIEHWNWVYPSISFETRAIPVATGAPPNGWGANIILLAMASGPINRSDATYFDLVDQMVAMAKANGAYTLLTYRTAEPDGDQPTMPDQAAQDAMAVLAARYVNEPAVLYGLQVEPHDVSWATLKPRFTSMIDAIRARNPRALIAVPGTNYDRYVYFNLTDPILRDNLIFKIDYYDPFSSFDADYQLTAVAAVYPVILTEFGAGSQSTLTDVVNLLNKSESLGISWIGWLFYNTACPCMLTDNTTFATTAYGQEIKNRLQAVAVSTATLLATLQGRVVGLPAGGRVAATVTLSPGNVAVPVAADGTFQVPGVAAGAYTVTMSAPGYLSAVKANVAVGSSPITLPDVQLRAGLVNSDGVVNIQDISALVAAFGSTPANRVDALGRFVDENGDGVVNIQDISLVMSSFGMSSPQTWP